MLKKLHSLIFTVLFSFLFISSSNAQAFFDNFDSYTAGQGLACQNPTDWTTWSNSPCGADDADVSNLYSLSSPNSVVIIQDDDLVKLLGDQSSGTWYVSFDMYIPSGNAGYFNIESDYQTYWAFETYFDAGGAGRLIANHVTTNFTWPVATWTRVQAVINLTSGLAELWVDNSMILSWPWTEGSSTGSGPLIIDAIDFYGATATDQMYVDNFWFNTVPYTPAQFTDNFDSYTAGQQLCTQTTDWETWSGPTGTGEDPFVSTTHAYSSPNSVVIVGGNDLIRMHNKTTGKWYMSFLFYIPETKSGYFNTMNEFIRPSTFTWGMDSYFDVGGGGRLDTTGGGGVPANTVNFTWAVAQWNQVVVIVDLDSPTPLAEYWIGTDQSNFTQIAAWDWTQGGSKPNALAVNDLFGAAATDEMYVDDYYFDDEMPTIVPVELTSFTASVNPQGQAVLNWVTATELNNRGFEIERRATNGQFLTIGFVDGYGTTSEEKTYSYVDRNVIPGVYAYRLKQIDFDGTFEYSEAVELEIAAPVTFGLDQNYPNPFNPNTNIKFSLSESGNVKLAIYNTLGEEVAVLVNNYTEAGLYELNFNAANLPSGTYIYRLEAPGYVEAKKMILMK